MRFLIDDQLLARSRVVLSGRSRLYWVVGGAGSGKTTICRALSARHGLPIYDMDAHIYGAYHGRFTQERHPANWAWSTAPNPLAWLLDMTWDEFHSFNRAALPEYLDLLADDLEDADPNHSTLIDGGTMNPALVARVISPHQVVCLSTPDLASVDIWGGTGERKAMEDAIRKLPRPGEMWRRFLEFDRRITETILRESQASDIPVCSRGRTESVDEFATSVASALGI